MLLVGLAKAQVIFDDFRSIAKVLAAGNAHIGRGDKAVIEFEGFHVAAFRHGGQPSVLGLAGAIIKVAGIKL
ncbi:hypothetical protein CFL01nite_07000 [Corynebacterium flavescens]|uniref:Uncharacterized protein n=1 Tax=Corynebacterium flavescens TaxID=28028 RepID=A0AB73B5N3_CORFL|nr:hypothetical protein CFL01nite_07000 [Corynebacterium flavescens]